MATIIKDVNVQKLAIAPYSLLKIIFVGMLAGITYWSLFSINLIFFPSITISSNIATVLVIACSIAIMVRLRMAQPLIISVASGLALWGLGGLASGLNSIEKILWFCLIYCLAYTLFSWLMHFKRVGFAVIFSAIIIIVLRIILSY